MVKENKTYEDYYNEGHAQALERCKKIKKIFPKPIAITIMIIWVIMDLISALLCMMIAPIEFVGRSIITKFKNK